MTITYEYGGNLYINMTNQCPNACDFCLRQNSSGSLYADNLWYEGAEPSKEAMLADIRTRDLKKYGEIVFCGYASPPAAGTTCSGLPRRSSPWGRTSCASTRTGLRTASRAAAPPPKCAG